MTSMDPAIFQSSNNMYGNNFSFPMESTYMHPTNEGYNINHLTETDISTLIAMCNDPSLLGKDLKDSASVANSSLKCSKTPRRKAKATLKKCNHCFVTFTDSNSYWAHYRTHLSKTKIFACNDCPFVTEYKHHFGYHLKQHAGVKPFKCKLCSYEGISKYTLTSHMKSHSAVHQYRCGDCGFGGKYIRQLLSHLQKTGHKPGQFLKPDGTPDDRRTIEICRENRNIKLLIKIKRDLERYEPEESIKDVANREQAQDPMFCDICQFKFNTKYETHMSYHRKDRPFMCNKCGHDCSDRIGFYGHMIIYHNGHKNK